MDVLDESARIREMLRKARTEEEIKLVADEVRPTVQAMAVHSEEGKIQARIIRNLRDYRIQMIKGRAGDH